MTIKYLFLCLSVIFAASVFAQNTKGDSLKHAIHDYNLKHKDTKYTIKDSVIVNLYQDLSDYTYVNHLEESLNYNRKALKIADKIGYDKGILFNNYILGTYYASRGEHILALRYLNSANTVAVKLKNDFRIANIANEKGIIFSKMGNYPEAVRFSLIALKYYEKTQNLQLFGNSLVNVGILYKHQENFKQALEYYQKAIIVFNKLNNEIKCNEIIRS